MEKAKVENYSAEVTNQLIEQYAEGASVEALANAFGKSVRSVIAKLTREKVYVSKAKAKGATRVTKAKLVARIAELTDSTEFALDSLEKATHEALEIVLKSLEACKGE